MGKFSGEIFSYKRDLNIFDVIGFWRIRPVLTLNDDGIRTTIADWFTFWIPFMEDKHDGFTFANPVII